MIDLLGKYETITIIIISLFIIYWFKKIIDKERLEENQLKEKVEKDEFIYDPETGGKLTLEQAEEGYSLIDPSKNESGLPYLKVIEITHEEVVDEKFEKLPFDLKSKINKKIISEIIGLIEEITYPDMILTDKLLDKTYKKVAIHKINLNKNEIKLIWEI